jgi:hypothetical protein
LRDIYNIPSTKFSNEASLGLIEFLDYASYDKTALGQFLTGTNNPTWSIPANQTIGPFGGDGLESVLDVQYGGTLARGASIWFITGQRWLLDFTQEFMAMSKVCCLLACAAWFDVLSACVCCFGVLSACGMAC